MDQHIYGGPRKGRVTIPSSKSMAHRLMIAAMLSEKECRIACSGISGDILSTAECLRSLGCAVAFENGSVCISPSGKRKTGFEASSFAGSGPAVLDCGESGSTLRFLLPVCAALGRSSVFVMSEGLARRPLDELTDVLKAHGASVTKEGNTLTLEGRLSAGHYTIPGNISSQYITGLLFALPLLEKDSILTVTGALQSEDYVLMTEKVLDMAGVSLCKEGNEYRIFGGQSFDLPAETEAEGDWSSAAFFLCMGALSEEGITVLGLDRSSAQGDRRILDILRSFGARVFCDEGGVTVKKGALKAIEMDASSVPDLVPAAAALAALADGTTRITHAERLRFKESDRLKTTAAMLTALGAEASELEDGLVINGRSSLEGGFVPRADDHRIAMAAAVAASGCKNEVIAGGAECVGKSYPDFWDHLGKLEASNEQQLG